MAELFTTEEEEWVEISDGEGHKASLRHLATIRDGEKLYHVLGAFSPSEDGDGGGLLLVREDDTADGAKEYVVASDEKEIASVVGSFVLRAIELAVSEEDEEPEDGVCACGARHAPGEFCVCDDPELLQ